MLQFKVRHFKIEVYGDIDSADRYMVSGADYTITKESKRKLESEYLVSIHSCGHRNISLECGKNY